MTTSRQVGLSIFFFVAVVIVVCCQFHVNPARLLLEDFAIKMDSNLSRYPLYETAMYNLAVLLERLSPGPSSEGMNEFVEVEMKVRDSELDEYGVVNNGVYSRYCQHGRLELLKRIGLSADVIARTGSALVSQMSVQYLAPLRSGDKFVVKVRISDSSAARILLEHYIYKLPNEEPVFEAKGTIVWLNKKLPLIRIPSEVKSKISLFMRHETK